LYISLNYLSYPCHVHSLSSFLSSFYLFFFFFFFFFNDTATTEIYTLSLHDALPISRAAPAGRSPPRPAASDRCGGPVPGAPRSGARRSGRRRARSAESAGDR